MKLRLLYFGIVRERLGRREETREFRADLTVGELVAELAGTDGILALGAASLRIAVNREYVGDSHVLEEDDEVAVIPPVAGGSRLHHPPRPDSQCRPQEGLSLHAEVRSNRKG